jgi:Tol biopolymer transport system component
MAMLVAAAIVLAASGTAQAAGPGDVILTGALPLPAGAIAGGNGGYAGGDPTDVGVSADGRYVAFAADADALAPEAHPDVTNIFRKDRATGEVVLISRADGAAGAPALLPGSRPAISDDGNRVAWVTTAALVAADTDTTADVYVRDVSGAVTMLATPGTTDGPWDHDLSGDGGHVVFDTAAPLAGADDANGTRDVYRRTLDSGTTTLVSRKSGTPQAAGASFEPAISDSGRWVAFVSEATDVTTPYTPGSATRNVYARDMTAGAAYLVSNQSGAATTGANGDSGAPDIAGAPGAALGSVYVAYNSNATNATTAGVDTSSAESVYRRRLTETSSLLISRATGAGGANADSRAHRGGISDDASRITFSSDADNLAGDDYYGAYVRDVGAGTTVLSSADNAYAVYPDISDDGAVVAWINGSSGIVPEGDPDLVGVFARVGAGPVELVSRPPGTAPFLAPATQSEPGNPGARSISADGRYMVFAGYSRRLPGNAAGQRQVYRRDLVTGTLDLVSRANGADGAPATMTSDEPSISADGTRVAFRSFARLDPADADDYAAIYVRDLAAGTTTLVSRAPGQDGAIANASARLPGIAAGGRHVVFTTIASNLGAPGPVEHAYLRDLATGATHVVDRASGAAGTIGNDDVDSVSVSGDGRLVAFTSRANTLDPDDPAPLTQRDVYVRDTVAATTLLVSRRAGLAGAKATGGSGQAAISADGAVVAFETSDEALAPEGGPWGGTDQVVARRVATGENALVSRAADGTVAHGHAEDPTVSGDGSVIGFGSEATNLLPGVGGSSRRAVFARAMATGAVSGPPAFGLTDIDPQSLAIHPSISDDGQCLAFHARGHNAFTGPAGDTVTPYVYVRSGGCPSAPAGGGGPGPVVTPAAKAAITRASLLRKRFRVGRQATAKRAAAARRAKAGTAFRFDLSAPADVTITIARRAPGRRAGGTCRKPARKLRKRPACVRFVRRGALVRTGLAVKRHRVAFSGRIGRKALKPGRYRATLVARNAAGKSAPVRLGFRVVRRSGR